MPKNIFLDYGELIFHYDFNRDTLLRAHKLALKHINARIPKRLTLEQLNRAHHIEIQCYLTFRNKDHREKPLNEMIADILWELDMPKEVSPENVARIYQDNDHDVRPMATTLESLPELSKFGKLGIISNLPHGSIHQELGKYGIREAFDPIVVSYEVGYRKPHPAIYQEALKRAQITPEQGIFFSHEQEEVDGALAVGMRAHLVRNLGEAVTKLKTSS